MMSQTKLGVYNTVLRRQKIENAFPLPIRMQVSVPNFVPMQPSELEIIISEFAFERLKMEQKYLRLQEVANKAESNARVYERKAKKMTNVCAKKKNENENLYMANKKLCGQVKDTKIGRFFGTQRKKGEASQRESNHWQTQAIEAQTKIGY